MPGSDQHQGASKINREVSSTTRWRVQARTSRLVFAGIRATLAPFCDSPDTVSAVLSGRETERAAISALLGAARASHGGALIVRGVAGSGKSALLPAEDSRQSVIPLK